jgi:hypothetical protein
MQVSVVWNEPAAADIEVNVCATRELEMQKILDYVSRLSAKFGFGERCMASPFGLLDLQITSELALDECCIRIELAV